MTDVKSRVEKAMNAYLTKDLRRGKRRGKNKTPEKDLQREIMKWLDDNKFSCHVVESKAVYSVAAGQYVRGQTVAGMPDIVGCDLIGTGVFIELKAKGRRGTLKEHQRQFLEEKIAKGAFAICCDSVEYLDENYRKWFNQLVGGNLSGAKSFLFSLLDG